MDVLHHFGIDSICMLSPSRHNFFSLTSQTGLNEWSTLLKQGVGVLYAVL